MTDTEIAGEDRVNPFGRKFLKDNTQQAHLRGLRALSHASTAYILPSTQRTDISLQLVMNQLEQIAMLQQRSFSGPAWHGLSVEEIVGDITTAQAVARPPLGQFSIWQHVLHMIFWKDKVTNAMHGEAMPSSSQVTTEENWPTVTDTGDDAWLATLSELRACEQRLQSALADFSAGRLAEKVKGKEYDFAFALYSTPCHDTYHAAQIVLLKKAFK